ncbi:ABC transporter permease, partial [Nocardia cyriacigeorgica]|uniref:ABC transporter permease n=1 Tax=Nocardia cyriacigeorgica TaxID=135487 RepID=UPI001E554F80
LLRVASCSKQSLPGRTPRPLFTPHRSDVFAVVGDSLVRKPHYFYQFISGWDVTASVIKVLVFGTAVILIHSYHGFFAVGGPEGVGIASGRAVRASFVAIIGLDMVLTLLLWGVNSSIEFTG